jgi:hypothetical protein
MPIRPHSRHLGKGAVLAGLAIVAAFAPGGAQARPFYLLRSVADARMIIDPAGIEIVAGGPVRRMWTVTVQANIANETPPQPGYVRALNEYDCAAQKTRWRSFSVFSRAGGVLLKKENNSPDWTDVTPASGTIGEWRVACGYSSGDSAVEADSIAKVVIALMRAFDPMPAPTVAPAPKAALPAVRPKAPASR